MFPLFKKVWKEVHCLDLVTGKEYFHDQGYASHDELAQLDENYSPN